MIWVFCNSKMIKDVDIDSLVIQHSSLIGPSIGQRRSATIDGRFLLQLFHFAVRPYHEGERSSFLSGVLHDALPMLKEHTYDVPVSLFSRRHLQEENPQLVLLSAREQYGCSHSNVLGNLPQAG